MQSCLCPLVGGTGFVQSPMLLAPPLLAKNPPALSTQAHPNPCLQEPEGSKKLMCLTQQQPLKTYHMATEARDKPCWRLLKLCSI